MIYTLDEESKRESKILRICRTMFRHFMPQHRQARMGNKRFKFQSDSCRHSLLHLQGQQGDKT